MFLVINALPASSAKGTLLADAGFSVATHSQSILLLHSSRHPVAMQTVGNVTERDEPHLGHFKCRCSMAMTGLTSIIIRVWGGLLDLDDVVEVSSVKEDTVVFSSSSLADENSCRSMRDGSGVGGRAKATLLPLVLGNSVVAVARFQSDSLLPSFLASVDASGLHFLVLEEELLFCGVAMLRSNDTQ